MPQFPAVISLSSLDGTNGFQTSTSSGLGYFGLTASVAAGDINGDGFDDLIIGDPNANGYTGAAYVVFGKASGFPANLVLSGVDGSNGFKIAGRGGYFGGAVASAGDVNGDGFDDLIIGATGVHPNGYASGAAYVVFGKASGFGALFNVSSINGSNGFEIDGAAALDGAGWPVSSAGDVNGDGFADVIVSAQPHTAPNNSAGASYVVFGRASGFGASLNVSSLDGSNGFTITGEMPGDYSHAVTSAGDFNGDGFSDLLIKAKNASYIVFGKASGFGANLNLSNLNGSNGFKLNNVGTIAPAGDVNRDGFADLIIGDGGDGNAAGTSYVVFGNASGFPDLSGLNGSNGFKITGEAAGDHSGVSVGSAGDVNGDGFDDLIIGASNADPNGTDSGASYVVFGKASGFAASLALSSLDGTNGFKIAGAAPRDFSGWSVSSAGDVNGDGVADITISANLNRSYVVFGHSTGRTETSSSSEGDFNGDGKADVLWRNDNGAVDLWRSNPGSVSVTFADQDLGVYSSTWHIKQAADFNGDGKADVLWRNDNGAVDLWRSNPGSVSVTFADQDLGVYSSAWHIEQAADFNGDGKADVLWRNNNGAVDLWRSNPGSVSVTFADQNLGVHSSAWHIEQVADFNGDGKADVLWRNTNGAVDLWRSNPGSVSVTFADQNLGVYSSAWHIEQAADFNGDGKADVLWRNTNGAVDLWRSNPGSVSVTFADQNLGVYSSAWHIEQAADFNGDGKADVLWGNDNGDVDLWRSNPGSVTFADQDLGVYSSDWYIT